MKDAHREFEKRYTRLSDRGLLHFFVVQTDHEAFAEIVRRYQRLVMSVCRRVTGNREDAEDAFQATFTALAHRPKQLRKAASLGTWLYSVAWRTSVRAVRLKRRRRMQPIPEDVADASLEDCFEAMTRDRKLIVLDEELNRLPEHYRTVLVLNYFADYSNQQIADELQLTKGAVDGNIRRARNALRVRLVRRGITLSALTAAAALSSNSAAGAPIVLLEQTLASGLNISGNHRASETPSNVRQLARRESGSFTWPISPLIVLSAIMLAGTASWHNATVGIAVGDEPVTLNAVVKSVDTEATAETPKPTVVLPALKTDTENSGTDEALRKPAAEFTDEKIRVADEDKLLSAEGQWGGISGQIILDGPVPKRRLLHAKGVHVKDDAVCNAGNVFEDSFVVNPQNNGIANCYVFLRDPPNKIHPHLIEPKVKQKLVDQKGCIFIPHNTFLQLGQSVAFTSSDPVVHNVHTMPIRNQPMSTVVGPKAKRAPLITFKPKLKETVPFPISCDFHRWMKAYCLVLEHPYAAITDADGRFRIVGLPAGLHELRIWHERVGYINRKYEVIVPDGEVREHKSVIVPADRFEN